MTYQVIDNFLKYRDFEKLKDSIIDNVDFSWFMNNDVTSSYDVEETKSFQKQDWNWYMTHTMYLQIPYSTYFQQVSGLFAKEFDKLDHFKTWIRIKANLYPYTSEVKEHQKHQDYPFTHKAAVFSLNTCDGFTRMSDGTKIDSVENRIIIFDGSEYHNSSTTSNSKQRVNINFNWL
jgi:hypothetical protein